jgi:hypothetical protein
MGTTEAGAVPMNSRDQFYFEYGAAMAAWAFVESELCTLFISFTQIPPALATSIFYSVNAFEARAKIFESAIEHSTLDEKAKEFFEAIIAKAKSLSQFRNKLAHDLMVDKSLSEHFLVPGRSQFQNDAVKAEAMLKAVSIEDIKAGRKHFDQLAAHMFHYWAARLTRDLSSLETLPALVAAIPNPAHTRPHFPTNK